MMDLSGIYPPLPTAFDAAGELAIGAFQSNIRCFEAFPLRGALVLGSTGEFVLLSSAEKLRLVEATRTALGADKVLLAGTGCPSTTETIELTQAAARSGADAALVIHPHYYKGQMTDDVIVGFFHEVADSSPVPVLVYNMPGCTGMDLSAELLIRIGAHENIVGWKDSGSDLAKMKIVVAELGASFRLLIGSANYLLDALSIGAVGGILALANIAPRECLELKSCFDAGRLDEAQALQRRLTPINQAVTARFGIAGLKQAMDALGLHGGPVRKPLLGLSAQASGDLLEIIHGGDLPRLA